MLVLSPAIGFGMEKSCCDRNSSGAKTVGFREVFIVCSTTFFLLPGVLDLIKSDGECWCSKLTSFTFFPIAKEELDFEPVSFEFDPGNVDEALFLIIINRYI